MRRVMLLVMCPVMLLGVTAGCDLLNGKPKGDTQKGDANAKPTTPLNPPVRNPNPKADKEGMEWGLKELGEHLKAKGVITSYELPAKESSESFGYTVKHPMLVKMKDTGEIAEIRRHDGSISAEKAASGKPYTFGSAVSWGAFSIINQGENQESAYHMMPALPGCTRFK